MTATDFAESVVEQAAVAWFESLGYAIAAGPDLAPDGPSPERHTFHQVVLTQRLRDALGRLNPAAPADAIDDALRLLTRPASADLIAANHAFHRALVNGVELDRTGPDGRPTGLRLQVVDYDTPTNNDGLVVNQLTVLENKHNRRPDLVVFLNGLPIALFELKDPTNPQATIWSAFNQLQTYKQQIPSLLAFNELLVISDGLEARVGSLTSDRERFTPWRTVAGDDLAPDTAPQLQVVIEGLFTQRRLLDYLRHFVIFEIESAGRGAVHKKLAAYHQFHAVNRAVAETVRATHATGDRRVGVVWHTQGSGKSLTMAFYAGRVIADPALENPTLVVLTDRNDLDDQLFGTFSHCQDLLAQVPEQAEDRAGLRRRLSRASGGVVFTTIQKFLPEEKGDRHPLLTNRRNVVVIADEAHRSQYDFIDGFARHLHDALPNASFIGFTGTPIDLDDRSTQAVFGDYISVYDIQQAVEDGATVPSTTKVASPRSASTKRVRRSSIPSSKR